MFELFTQCIEIALVQKFATDICGLLSIQVKPSLAMNELSNHRMSRPVAVLLDGRIIAAPVLMQPVRDTLTINFGSTKTAAKEAGALEQAVNDPQTADSTASDPS